jgi:hypothetical protein
MKGASLGAFVQINLINHSITLPKLSHSSLD